ncbi:MAG: type II secretion system protein [Actinomycetes bacterium]
MLKRTRKAFTLLELVVAIVVLGILAALAIPSFAQVITNSKQQIANNTALSTARDAVAIAATTGGSAVLANYQSASTENAGVTSVVAGSVLNTVKFTVSGLTVCVTMPTLVNGTPALTGSC